MYANKTQITGEYVGHARVTLNPKSALKPGLPNPVYNLLVNAKNTALPALDDSNPYAIFTAWMAVWDFICMEERGAVCPKPDSLGVTRRGAMAEFFGMSNIEYRNDRSCGNEFCPMCMMRRIAELDRLTAKNFHVKNLYGYYRKECGLISTVNDVSDSSYVVQLAGMDTKIEPVYAMKRLTYVGNDTWSKNDYLWARQYVQPKDKDRIADRICGHTPVPAADYVNSRFAFYEAALPDAEIIGKLVAWDGSPQHEWVLKLVKQHNTRKAFRILAKG